LQALHKIGRLPQGQAEQDFEGQTGLNGRIAVGLPLPLPASAASGNKRTAIAAIKRPFGPLMDVMVRAFSESFILKPFL
jgi:hypothetical protein